MRLGFTGTREVPVELVGNVQYFVSAVSEAYDEFTTGACVGFDAIAAQHLLDTRPDATHRLVVPWNTSQVDWDVIHRFQTLAFDDPNRYLIEWMPEGTSYRDRNVRLVGHSDALAAVVGYPEAHGKSRRSGSWQTIRLAKRANVGPRSILTLSELQVPA